MLVEGASSIETFLHFKCNLDGEQVNATNPGVEEKRSLCL